MAIFSWLWSLIVTFDNLSARGFEWLLKRLLGQDCFKKPPFKKQYQSEGHQGSGAMIVFALVALIAAVVIPLLFV